MGFGLHPIFMIAAVTLLGAVIMCIVFACLASRWSIRSILIVVAIILLVPSGLVLMMLKPELVDARFSTYKRLYGNIEVGMSRAEVMTLVEKHYPPEGKRLRPKVLENSEARLDFFMNPEESKGKRGQSLHTCIILFLVVFGLYLLGRERRAEGSVLAGLHYKVRCNYARTDPFCPLTGLTRSSVSSQSNSGAGDPLAAIPRRIFGILVERPIGRLREKYRTIIGRLLSICWNIMYPASFSLLAQKT